jgi:hypothetical protein
MIGAQSAEVFPAAGIALLGNYPSAPEAATGGRHRSVMAPARTLCVLRSVIGVNHNDELDRNSGAAVLCVGAGLPIEALAVYRLRM